MGVDVLTQKIQNKFYPTIPETINFGAFSGLIICNRRGKDMNTSILAVSFNKIDVLCGENDGYSASGGILTKTTPQSGYNQGLRITMISY